jgi:hypothetical protein
VLLIKVSGKMEEKLGKDKLIERFEGTLVGACVRAQDIFNQKSFKRSYVMVADPNHEPVYIYGAGGEKNYAGVQLPTARLVKAIADVMLKEGAIPHE